MAHVDIHTDQVAHYQEIQRKLMRPRQIAPTQVVPTAKHAADDLNVPAETQQDNELFRADNDSLETALTPAEVEAAPVPSFEDMLAAFHRFANEERQVPTLRELLLKVSEVFCIPFNELKSERRATRLVNARHAFFFLARGLTYCSFPKIGLYCGGRDHATVIHGARRCEKLLDQNEDYRAKVNAVASHFGAAA